MAGGRRLSKKNCRVRRRMKKKIIFMILLLIVGLAVDEIIQPVVTNTVYMQQMAINNEGITFVRIYNYIRGLIPFLYILIAIKLFYKDVIKFLKEKFK